MTPTHDVAWFLAVRLPELAQMGGWELTEYGVLRHGAACVVSAPKASCYWRSRAMALGLSPAARGAIIRAADNETRSYDPAIRAALLAALVPEHK